MLEPINHNYGKVGLEPTVTIRVIPADFGYLRILNGLRVRTSPPSLPVPSLTIFKHTNDAIRSEPSRLRIRYYGADPHQCA